VRLLLRWPWEEFTTPLGPEGCHVKPVKPGFTADPKTPSRYAPGADEHCARPSAREWHASPLQHREPHQQALPPPTSLLVSLSQLAKFSRDERPEGSRPAFAVGSCRLEAQPYPTHYRSAFACSLLLYPPLRQRLLRFTFPEGETTGLPRSVAVTVWVRSRLSAGGSTPAPEEFGASGPGHIPFGPSLSASLACPL
jgi:hypothetical protein